MSLAIFYKVIAGAYDLLDVIYFRNYESSPRKAVLEAIDSQDTVLDLCTGTATKRKILSLPLHLLEPKPYRTFIKKDLHEYFASFGLEIVEEIHCDYSKVLKIQKSVVS